MIIFRYTNGLQNNTYTKRKSEQDQGYTHVSHQLLQLLIFSLVAGPPLIWSRSRVHPSCSIRSIHRVPRLTDKYIVIMPEKQRYCANYNNVNTMRSWYTLNAVVSLYIIIIYIQCRLNTFKRDGWFVNFSFFFSSLCCQGRCYLRLESCVYRFGEKERTMKKIN